MAKRNRGRLADMVIKAQPQKQPTFIIIFYSPDTSGIIAWLPIANRCLTSGVSLFFQPTLAEENAPKNGLEKNKCKYQGWIRKGILPCRAARFSGFCQ